jgi:transposase-like protein
MSYLVMENNSMNDKKHPELAKSDVIKHMPKACGDETAAVEFFEQQRWGDSPLCPHCQSANVYKMTGRDGARNKRYLWRCRACGEQYTVRTGAIYEDSKLPLRHWAYGFWRVCASKKGVSAREIERNCQITHKSALFLMHRIRFALTEDQANRQKLGNTSGICEVDETFVGGKPPPGDPRTVLPGYRKNSNKVPVVAVVERGGHVRTKVVPNVTQNNVGHFLFENIENGTIVNTDQSPVYHTILYPITKHLGGRHDIVNHSKQKYTERNEDGTTSGVNCAESFFSLIKRGLLGTFHAVSKEHLHRYCDEFAFRWDTRKLNDGERVVEAVKRTEGKRLTYDQCVCRE